MESEFFPVTPRQLASLLADHAEARESVGILGQPGVGKSELVKAVATTVGLPTVVRNLGLSDSTDLKGLPSFTTGEHLSVSWVKDVSWLSDVPTCQFLDELPNAQQATIAAAASVILEKRIDDLFLHPDTWVIWAGNRSSDKAASNRVPSHVLNRCYLYELTPSAEDWVEFEIQQQATDILTIKFVQMKGDASFDFDPARSINPTPRAWSTISRKIAALDAAGKEVPIQMVAGRIGKGFATELAAFRAIAATLPSREEIALMPETARIPAEPSAFFLVSDMLADWATPNNFDTIAKYMARLPKEWQAMCVKNAVKRDRALLNTPTFTKWGIQFADYLR